MNNFRNAPRVDKNAEGKIPRWIHQPLSIDHYGTHFTIHENGKVTISAVSKDQTESTDGEIMTDEIEVSASLIFKIARLLQDTRKQVFVDVADKDRIGSPVEREGV